MLLRRIGSSLAAGLSTATKILGHHPDIAAEEDEEISGWDLEPPEEKLLTAAIDAHALRRRQ